MAAEVTSGCVEKLCAVPFNTESCEHCRKAFCHDHLQKHLDDVVTLQIAALNELQQNLQQIGLKEQVQLQSSIALRKRSSQLHGSLRSWLQQAQKIRKIKPQMKEKADSLIAESRQLAQMRENEEDARLLQIADEIADINKEILPKLRAMYSHLENTLKNGKQIAEFFSKVSALRIAAMTSTSDDNKPEELQKPADETESVAADGQGQEQAQASGRDAVTQIIRTRDKVKEVSVSKEVEEHEITSSRKESKYQPPDEQYNEYWAHLPQDPSKLVPVPSKVVGLYIFPNNRKRILAVCRQGQIQVFKVVDLTRTASVQIQLPTDVKKKRIKIGHTAFDAESKQLFFSLESPLDGIFVCQLGKTMATSDVSGDEVIETKRFVHPSKERAFCGMVIDQEHKLLLSCDPFCQFNIGAWSLETNEICLEGFVQKPPFTKNFRPICCAVSRPIEQQTKTKQRLLAVSDLYGYGRIYLYAVGKTPGDYRYLGTVASSHYPDGPSHVDSTYIPSALLFDPFSNLLLVSIGSKKIQNYSAETLPEIVWQSSNLEALPAFLCLREPASDNDGDDEEGEESAYNMPVIIAASLHDNSIVSLIAKKKT